MTHHNKTERYTGPQTSLFCGASQPGGMLLVRGCAFFARFSWPFRSCWHLWRIPWSTLHAFVNFIHLYDAIRFASRFDSRAAFNAQDDTFETGWGEVRAKHRAIGGACGPWRRRHRV